MVQHSANRRKELAIFQVLPDFLHFHSRDFVQNINFGRFDINDRVNDEGVDICCGDERTGANGDGGIDYGGGEDGGGAAGTRSQGEEDEETHYERAVRERLTNRSGAEGEVRGFCT